MQAPHAPSFSLPHQGADRSERAPRSHVVSARLEDAVTCRHTTRFLLAYLTFLPLALWAPLRWATLAVAPLIAFLLTGVENISVMIENPMISLPMDAYCESIRRDVVAVGERWALGFQVCSRNSTFWRFLVWLQLELHCVWPMACTVHVDSTLLSGRWNVFANGLPG